MRMFMVSQQQLFPGLFTPCSLITRVVPLVGLGALLALTGCSGVSTLPGASSPRKHAGSGPGQPLPPPPGNAAMLFERPGAAPHLRPAEWAQLPGWEEDDLVKAWPAW